MYDSKYCLRCIYLERSGTFKSRDSYLAELESTYNKYLFQSSQLVQITVKLTSQKGLIKSQYNMHNIHKN